jgi:hypothetical protein
VTLQLTLLVLVIAQVPAPAVPQPRPKIAIALEARTEGKPEPDAAAAKLLEEVRRGFAVIPDVEIVPADGSRRTIWIITGATAGVTAASLMITEHYDRETLMVLGIEDDEMAFRMMALQIVSDHQIFTGPDAASVGKRIVKAVDEGIFARLRKLPPRP